MSEYLQKIIYLTKAQYNTLQGGGTVGSQTGLNNNYLYCTTDEKIGTTDLATDLIVPVAKGGTGKTSFTAGSVLVGNGQTALTELPATNQNTANTLVKRDSSGNFSAGTITAALSGNATTMDYPSGFTSKATSATWGNTTGTFVTSWVAPNSSAIAFMRDNPSSGKLSVKVDGRYYFNEGATPAAGLKSANSYWGMTDPDGTDSVWIRTTTQGIIPYQSGGANAGHCQLGTDTWYFSKGYIQNIYGTLNGTATKATQDGDGNAINTTYLKKSGGTMTGGITLPSKDTAFNTYNLVFSSGGIIGGNTSGNIGIYAGTIYLRGGSNNTTNSGQGITVTGTQVDPYETNAVSLGTSSLKYKNIYATTFTGNLTGNVTGDVTGNADTATNATNDSDGNAINTTYVKKVPSTLNAIAKFSGTDGQIQNSKAILEDNGGLTLEKTAASWPSSLAMLTLKGANSKDFKFSFSGSGTNVDIGYDWGSAAGAGAAFRSSSFYSNADNANNGAFVFYARKKDSTNTTKNYELIGNTDGLLTWDTKRVATYDGTTNDFFTIGTTLRIGGETGGNRYILMGNMKNANNEPIGPGIIRVGNGVFNIGTGTDWTSNAGGTLTSAISTRANGYVGIATVTWPTVALDVGGDLKTSGAATIGTTLTVGTGAYISGASTTLATDIFKISNSSDASWTPSGSFLAPSLTATHYNAIQIGVKSEDKNIGHLSFYFAGNKSTNNRLALGFYNVIDILVVRADRKVGINTTAPLHDLSINGETSSTKFIITDGASTPNDKVTLQWNSTDSSLDFVFT